MRLKTFYTVGEVSAAKRYILWCSVTWSHDVHSAQKWIVNGAIENFPYKDSLQWLLPPYIYLTTVNTNTTNVHRNFYCFPTNYCVNNKNKRNKLFGEYYYPHLHAELLPPSACWITTPIYVLNYYPYLRAELLPHLHAELLPPSTCWITIPILLTYSMEQSPSWEANRKLCC
jgi:hypothetical protein